MFYPVSSINSLYKEVSTFGLGLPELIIVLVVALVVFGPGRLPSLGRSLGEAIRGFKKGLEGKSKESEKIEKQQIK